MNNTVNYILCCAIYKSNNATTFDATGSPSLRRAAYKTYKVMFTGYEDDKECKIVKDLGR